MKRFDTDRPYEEKKEDSRVKIKIDGYTLFVVGRDYWNGPSAPEEKGHWERVFVLE